MSSTSSEPFAPLWAHVDCNNFYASCEKLFRPDLAGKPVVVLSNNDGCIVARSAEAKALGIPMGVDEAQRLKKSGEVLERVGLSQWADAYPSHLSGGMRRALCKPDVCHRELSRFRMRRMGRDAGRASRKSVTGISGAKMRLAGGGAVRKFWACSCKEKTAAVENCRKRKATVGCSSKTNIPATLKSQPDERQRTGFAPWGE